MYAIINLMASFETTWKAPEFEYRPKSVSWYWISIIISAAIIAFAIWERNFLFGIFIVIAEILFIAWGNEAPATVNFTLTENDLLIGETKHYQIGLFENFSVDMPGGDWTEIFFTFRTKLKIPLKIMLPKAKIEEVRKNLRTILPEVEFEPSLLDSLEKIIGF
jgi:hypothetical protein